VNVLERLRALRETIPADQVVALATIGEALSIVEDYQHSGTFHGSASPSWRRMKGALRELARRGCSRLVDPSTCRKPDGYARDEWCEGCIAADGLGLPVEWYVLK